MKNKTAAKDYGYNKSFSIDRSTKKRVLITGAGSYIGESFEAYAKKQYPDSFTIDTLDMIGEAWRGFDFSSYDAIFHVAGIAHADVGRVSQEQKKKYYDVNSALAIETARKARAEGVGQFLYMSSMIIYGDSAPFGKEKVIGKHTVPAPANFYGDSKWRGDAGVRKLANDRFHVAVLRPPMIYGKDSKGNYPVLAKLAKRLPLFPDVENQRSMLFIDNLCEFVALLILSGEGGIYFPQNPAYTKTSELAREIAAASGHKIFVTKLLNPAVMLAGKCPGKISALVNKAFGNSVYDLSMSRYQGLDYQKVGLKESIRRTEGCANSKGTSRSRTKKPHILLISQYFYPETFRVNDMACEWVRRGYQVTVLTGIPNYPMGRFFQGYDYFHKRKEHWKGMTILRIPLIPRGSSSVGMVANYLSFVASGLFWSLTHNVHADLVFSFEVSPMTQVLVGCCYAARHKIPHYLYVQDLWPENVQTVTGISNPLIIKPIDRMVDFIYRQADEIFTTSPSFVKAIAHRGRAVSRDKVHYWPQYAEEFYRPMKAEGKKKDDTFTIAFTGNIGTAQGLDILPKVAQRLAAHTLPKNIRFRIVGDGRYQGELEDEIKRLGVSEFFDMVPRRPPEEIPGILSECDAAFLSFQNTRLWEMTIPAKLQSYMACGMPILAAVEGESARIMKEADCGLCSPIGDVDALADAILAMAGMERKALENMGENARAYCSRNFEKSMLMDRMDWFLAEGLKGRD